MNFEEAMNAVESGARVTRNGFDGYVFKSVPEEGESYIAKFSDALGETPFTAIEEDTQATDWVLADTATAPVNSTPSSV